MRYPRELRDDVDRLRARAGADARRARRCRSAQLADIELVQGPAMIRDENGFLAGYVYVDIAGRDIGGYVEEAKKRRAREARRCQPGYVLQWSGQYENMLRVRERLKLVVPVTLALIFVLLLRQHAGRRSRRRSSCWPCRSRRSARSGCSTSSATTSRSPPGSGMIALLGLDAETGVFMLLFLDLSYDDVQEARACCRPLADLDEAIVHGAVKRVRPKMMTVAAAFMGLLPIMWSTSAGADVMKRIAAPMIGGLVTSFLLELLVYPAIYKLWKRPGAGQS